MKDRDTPLRLVRKLERLYDDPYHYLDVCAGARDDGEVSYPDYCPIPISAAREYIAWFLGTYEGSADGAAELTACYAWRKCPVVYSFDADLAAALTEQADKMEDLDVLPTDILLHLPYPCVYVKTPAFTGMIDGFFAWIEFDLARKAPELRIQPVDAGLETSIPLVLHLINGSILQCLQDTVAETNRHVENPKDLETLSVKGIRPVLIAVQHLLYLSAQNADIEDAPAPAKVDRVRRKITPGTPKAGDVLEKQVGIRVGAALRKTYHSASNSTEAGTGTAKRPHTRRGHWHHYWSGAGDKRELVLKWTAPTVIHPEAADNDTVVVYPVKQQGG